MRSSVVLIVVVVPLTVKSPPTVTLPVTDKAVRVPSVVRLEETTLEASVVPTIPAASALVAGILDGLTYVNLPSIAFIAPLRVVPQPESPFSGILVVPSIKYVTEISVSYNE